MKKTLTVNLNNIVFHIDDDAYEMLQIYLADVEKHLSEEEKKEVMSDIEARIAELFTERLQHNKNVVNIDDVEVIINVLGKPSQFADEEADNNQSSTKSDKKVRRRYYRDPENAILGGVVGGIAAYLTWDTTLLRVIFVVLVFIGWGTIIPIYILIWLIAPAATTVSQRLEMQGENVTVDNIKTEINNVKTYVESDKFKQSATSFGSRLGDFLKWTLKTLAGLIGAFFGFIGIMILGALILSLLFISFEPSILNGFSPEIMTNWSVLSPEKISMIIVSLLLVIGCPLFMIVYWIIRIVLGRKDSSKTTSLVVFILWLAGLFMFYSASANTIISWKKMDIPWQFVYDDEDYSNFIDKDFDVDAFHGIDIMGNIELVLTQDTLQSVQISASENEMPEIKVKVKNGVLKVYSQKNYFNRRNKKIKMYVSTDSITDINLSGVCVVSNKKKMNSSNLSIDASGASKIKMDVDVKNKLSIDLSGACYCDIDGEANNLLLDISGVSKIEADQLITKSVDVEASGATKASVFATELADIEVTGVSEVRCDGNPKKSYKYISGASKIDIR